MNQQNFRKHIMRRIYAIWFVRRALPISAGAALGVFVTYRATADSFFVAKIIENFLSVSATNAWGAPRFMFAALLNTDPRAVLVISFSFVVAILLSLKLFSDIRTIMRESGSLNLQRN